MPDNSAAEATALVPAYGPALESNANDYIAFLKNWFQGAVPEIDSADIVRYAFSAGDKTADLAAEKLISGNEAFCTQNGGKIVQDPAALTCVVQEGKVIARLSVQVFHSSPEQQGTLQFTGESAAWISRLNEAQVADYRRVIDTLSGNGIGGGVLLSSGESFDVIRFGRLSGPDFYALKTPNHGLIWLEDVVTVKWGSDSISIMQRSGEQIEDTGKGLAPGSTIVRLRPTANDQLKAEALTFDQPFRFVYVDPKSKQPRQVRVRADALIVQITVSRQPSRFRAGTIQARFDKREADAFRKSLVAEARKTAANTGKKTDKVFAGVQADKIEEIRISTSGGDATTVKKDNATWQVVQPVAAKADETEVSGITSALATTDIVRVIDENPSSLTDYGLSNPRIEVDFKVAGDKDYRKLLIGEKSPTGSDLFAKRNDEKRVFLIPAFQETTFNKDTFALRDKVEVVAWPDARPETRARIRAASIPGALCAAGHRPPK
jgi:hypothetical protein